MKVHRSNISNLLALSDQDFGVYSKRLSYIIEVFQEHSYRMITRTQCDGSIPVQNRPCEKADSMPHPNAELKKNMMDTMHDELNANKPRNLRGSNSAQKPTK